jgi:hypothetical protein
MCNLIVVILLNSWLIIHYIQLRVLHCNRFSILNVTVVHVIIIEKLYIEKMTETMFSQSDAFFYAHTVLTAVLFFSLLSSVPMEQKGYKTCKISYPMGVEYCYHK